MTAASMEYRLSSMEEDITEIRSTVKRIEGMLKALGDERMEIWRILKEVRDPRSMPPYEPMKRRIG